jgi:sortase A
MLRRAGVALLVLGGLLLVWVGVTVTVGDPFTSLYTSHEQHGLARQLDAVDRRWASDKRTVSAAASKLERKRQLAAALKTEATAFRASLRDGEPVGRIIVPRLQLSMVVLQGTTEGDLAKGPGHYDTASGANTNLPGMGGVIGIAGHRTTFLHPFRHIDELRSGDTIVLVMPYGKFTYTVYDHEVVSSTDWSILRRRPFEKLVLSACHPLYSATHRWVVFARLTSESRT